MLVHRNNATSIEKYWDIMANAHVIAKVFLLFGGSAKLYYEYPKYYKNSN